MQNQCQVAQQQLKQVKGMLEEALDEKRKLEERVIVLEKQESIMRSDGGGNRHEDKGVIEKLNHKLEYLKAQLASEIRCKEELGATVATLTGNLDMLKREKKRIQAEADDG
jgi:hypothetical protein